MPVKQGKKEEGKCGAFFRIPSDDMAGDAQRRVPIHYYTRRKESGSGKNLGGTGSDSHL